MKIHTLAELAQRLEAFRVDGKRIVHCHGVFDLLHIGHIKHLTAARELGDVLVVTLTPDRHVNKGPHRPAFTESLRAEAIAALDCVDLVAVNEWPTAVETIKLLRPHLYVKGMVRGEAKRDFTDAIKDEEEAILAVGGRLVLTDEATYSASELINRHLDIFTPEARAFLQGFRQRYDVEAVVGQLNQLQDLKVLVVGETILDDYHFCEVIGKVSKEPVLASRYLKHETYAGGILAIANHVAGFCDRVTVCTALGEQDTRENFVRAHLAENTELVTQTIRGAPTIVKRRFVEESSGTKLFEIYNMGKEQMSAEQQRSFRVRLRELMPEHDLVIVADYGHGLIDEATVELLAGEAPFLAINVQTNAGNRGFNLVSKYPRADYVCIDEREARLEVRNTDVDLKELIRIIVERVPCRRCLVTTGKRGSVIYDVDEGLSWIPAFAIKLVDRIGAGDALLSVTAPCTFMGASADMVGFIGNVAGAEACGVMGNRRSIDPITFHRHIASLMK